MGRLILYLTQIYRTINKPYRTDIMFWSNSSMAYCELSPNKTNRNVDRAKNEYSGNRSLFKPNHSLHNYTATLNNHSSFYYVQKEYKKHYSSI